jgi:hypothetical protein
VDDSTHEWFEVRATVKVRAADENDAISRVAASIRTSEVSGLYPVGTFDARPADNPLTETPRRVD